MRGLPVLPGYRHAHVLIRYRGSPLCNVPMKVVDGCIRAADLWSCAWTHRGQELQTRILQDLLDPNNTPATSDRPLPTATIIVCTRNRTADLQRCLDSIVPQLSDSVEALVIDNNPSDDVTKKLVAKYPVRYYRENRAGLNWARARAAQLVSTDLLLYTDDDVALDSSWATEMRTPFTDEDVGGVAGAVVPMEFEHPSQELYERYGGFNRGYSTKAFSLINTVAVAAGRAGAGASMAVRRSLAVGMKLFECELDCGTPSYSGGDYYAFYRLIRAGYNIVYWPDAVAWHRHRQTPADLAHMLYGYGVGAYCVLLRCLIEHHDFDALLLALSWLCQYHLCELVRSLLQRSGSRPTALIWAEIRGVFHAPLAYWRVRRREQQMGPLASPVGVASA